MTNLSNLPDEILCNIFEYLSSFDAIYSFINLNKRFNCLLISFKQQIDLTYLSYDQFLYYMKNILPIINQDELLYVLKLGNQRTPGQIELFNSLIDDKNCRSYFNNIDQVIIESPRLNEFINFVNKFLLSLSELITLTIKIDYVNDPDFPTWTKFLTNTILPIATLIKLSIEIPNGLVLSRLPDSIMFPSLMDITLNVTLVTDLLILIQSTPNLRNLSIRIGWWTSGDQTLVKMIKKMCEDHNRTSYLIHLKKFHLSIDSILTFQFEHLEQVLYRIMNNETTYNFNFILRNAISRNNELVTQLLDGKRWENLLSSYSSLIQFDLFIRITDSLKLEQENFNMNLFQTKYFLTKKWQFSYFKYSRNDNIIFYSNPCKNEELFDISIDNLEIVNHFPINYISHLLIDQTNTKNYKFNLSIFDFILNQCLNLRQLTLIHIDINLSIIKPFNIPSLHTLQIEKIRNINLSNVLQLFPLINTLFLSYLTIDDQNRLSNIHRYNRIIELSLIDIPSNCMDKVQLFLNQFPNLYYLYMHISNQRMDDEYFLRNLKEITEKFPSLIYLKLKLEKDINSIDLWNEVFNNRMKMYLKENVFGGVLKHLWF
ncbi:unnamed protein product [Adineta steineri]|uniref:F-box domain-containing protein n=1 Tax=Adineta steineri TaxID=433720 RepID=A0A814KEU4_9BILA|nr:unnamed protein product [Adineta steineri]CAF1260709.1 unnamed protein product [Adineta steineri]CAF1316628.1 unnamed protein product [Adineta steineri]